MRRLRCHRSLNRGYFCPPTIYICIDALDEMLLKHRLDFLRSLKSIVQVSPNTRVFLTGRAMVLQEIKEHFAGAVMLPINPTKEDVETFLVTKLEGDTEPNAMDDDLRTDIMRVIPEKHSEMRVGYSSAPFRSRIFANAVV